MECSVNILFSASLNRFYVGHTSEDVGERLKKHLSFHNGYTSKAKDWKIVYVEGFPNKSDAYRRELDIKGKKSRKYILNLINPAEKRIQIFKSGGLQV